MHYRPRDRTDISDEVRGKLPAGVARALDEVEEVLGKRVNFFLVSYLGVTAAGQTFLEGYVELPPESRSNLSIIGEEIMHLHRWTRGYPAIKPSEMADFQDYGGALRGLGGYFDEYSFFPFLEREGLNPRGELQPRIVDAVEKLTGGLLDRIERDKGTGQFTLGWRVRLTVTYVRASLLACKSMERDLLVDLFKGTELRQYTEVGENISVEIVKAAKEAPDNVAERMRTCVFRHLGLPDSAATVRTYF